MILERKMKGEREYYFQTDHLVNHITVSQIVFEKITWSKITSTIIRKLRIHPVSPHQHLEERIERHYHPQQIKIAHDYKIGSFGTGSRSRWVTHTSSSNPLNELLR